MGSSSSKSAPGARSSFDHAEFLDRPLDADLSRLYWPSAPYEGPIRLRFACSQCHCEAVLLSPYPTAWRDILDLQGECFACGDMRRVETLFIESGTPLVSSAPASEPNLTQDGRAVIFRHAPNATTPRDLCSHLFLFLSSSPPSPTDLDVVLLLLRFDRTIRPHNFRSTAIPHYSHPIPIANPSPAPYPSPSSNPGPSPISYPSGSPSASPSSSRPSPPVPPRSSPPSPPNPNLFASPNPNPNFDVHYRSIHLDSGACLFVEPHTSGLLHELLLMSSTRSPWSWSSLFSSSARELRSFPPNFFWPKEVLSLPLADRHRLFLAEVNEKVRVHEVVKIRVNRSADPLPSPSSPPPPSGSEVLSAGSSSNDALCADMVKLLSLASTRHVRSFWNVEFSGELGVDFGGPTRELLTLMVAGLTAPAAGLFAAQGPMGALYPAPAALQKMQNQGKSGHLGSDSARRLTEYKVLGRVLARALMDGVRVPCALSRAVFKLLQGKPLGFDDLSLVDRDSYVQILRILHYDGALVDELALVFAGDDGTELVEGGAARAVTGENVFEWARLYAQWKLIDSVEISLEALLEGFYDVMPVQMLSLFSEMELEQVLCGVSTVDVDDLAAHAVVLYNLGSVSSSIQKLGNAERERRGRAVVEWMWAIMRRWSAARRLQLVQFVTGSGRAPVSFAHLHPPITVSVEGAMEGLPRAHTCFHRLDVPVYESEEEMQRSLEIALDYGLIGFGKR